ncbi:uncharacterized protein [Argopecten irradians]|uniref:uncharacterized protein isoform X2 n=1 Tax=Argopecten irradians TaxID=31199 RepID=UPI003712A2EB
MHFTDVGTAYLCLLFLTYVKPTETVIAGRNHVCVRQERRSTRYYTKCGTFNWDRCRKTRYYYVSVAYCCDGYLSKDNIACDYAICARRVDPNACSIYHTEYVEYRTGVREHNSGGSCLSPEVCGNCNDGFYGNGPNCAICPKIANCKHQRCTTVSDVRCMFCDGEVIDTPGWRAYTRHVDDTVSCKQTCSWRSNSRHCYPGTCDGEVVENCRCHPGFIGTHCETVMDDPSVLSNQLILTFQNENKKCPDDPNLTHTPETVWTNIKELNHTHAYFTAKNVIQGSVPTPYAFITNFKYGIIAGTIDIQLVRERNVTIYPWDPCANLSAIANVTNSMENQPQPSNVTSGNSTNNVTTTETDLPELFCVNDTYHMTCDCPGDLSENSTYLPDSLHVNCSCPILDAQDLTSDLVNCSCLNTTMDDVSNCTCVFDISYNFPTDPYYEIVVDRYDIEKICTSATQDDPIPVNYNCEHEQALEEWPLPFEHNDTVTFDLSTTNGGYVQYVDRDHNVTKRYNLVGRTFSNTYTVRFDFVIPRHCHLDPLPSNLCNEDDLDTLSVPDITSNINATFSWFGWYDELAGIGHYHYEVFVLQSDGTNLTEGAVVYSSSILSQDTYSDHFLYPHPGMFSIIFSAFDKGGNHRSMRRLSLFDDQSRVNVMPQADTYVATASVTTNYTWLTIETQNINVTWVGRFVNSRHDAAHWLRSVEPHVGVEEDLDDHEGHRNINFTDNVRGIVRFEIATEHEMYTGVNLNNFTNTSELYEEGAQVNISMEDGDKLNIMVRAYDVIGTYWQDDIYIIQDVSPPLIEDLWLTRGNRLNISVHSLEELTEMTVEWLVYDYHSGMHSVQWRLFDNFTGEEVQHGMDWLIAQGNSENLTDCESQYASYPRGANCYCTRYSGCYHQHYHVKPQLVGDPTKGGVYTGKERGVHNHDYVFEVTATNNALVNSTLSFKITIDTTPPHIGYVMEGQRGQPEVDFQQDLVFHTYWDGFFDKESGVLMYQYGVDQECIQGNKFQANGRGEMIHETYGTSALINVTTEGTYHVTVVAYNRAMEKSEPVCSDGITIVTTVPNVVEVVVKGGKVKGGVVRDSEDQVWILNRNRTRNQVMDPTTDCRDRATLIDDISLVPINRYQNGTNVLSSNGDCLASLPAPNSTTTVLGRTNNLDISWTISSNDSVVFDYEIGLSTIQTNPVPDLYSFISTNHHTHSRIRHPDLVEGVMFYVLVRTTSKANAHVLQSIGPMIIDTTPPDITGPITLEYNAGYLVTWWATDAVTDTEEPYNLNYQYAIGHSSFTTDIQGYEDIREGSTCFFDHYPPTCTAVDISKLAWDLHGHHTYYVTLKVQNTAGLYSTASSEPYTHDVMLPTPGSVLEISVEDIQDIDFQNDISNLRVKWKGFSPSHLNVTYTVSAGTTKNSSDMFGPLYVGYETTYLIEGLQMEQLETYYVTVEANSSAGSVTMASDGVTIVSSIFEPNIQIMDGSSCLDEGEHQQMSNSSRVKDGRLCDLDYQSSTFNIDAHWTIPDNLTAFITRATWSVEERSPFFDIWYQFLDFVPTDTLFSTRAWSLLLQPGRRYRSAVRFCAGEICYQSRYSSGVTVIPSPPVTSPVSVGVKGNNTVATFERFYDPDIEEYTQARDIVYKYSWALADGSHDNSLLSSWNDTFEMNTTHVIIALPPTDVYVATTCIRVIVMGYTKVNISGTVSADVSGCTEPRFDYIISATVLDAVGLPFYDEDGSPVEDTGREIHLSENAAWTEEDRDYTPYTNLLSAVWPRLMYDEYTWAVLIVTDMAHIKGFTDTYTEHLTDLCSHPNTIKCNTTRNKFVNVPFSEGQLQHGKRYMICIHAESATKDQEIWELSLNQTTDCSDGVTVDVTPPQAGQVWIGQEIHIHYQTSIYDMSINWKPFIDVEEFGFTPHFTGIKSYWVSIGSHPFGQDIIQLTNVGVVEHVTIHGLQLQNGHTYYATVQAYDFSNKSTSATSERTRIDITPPDKSTAPITLPTRHIVSHSSIQVCWTGVFWDDESGITYYTWALGSQPGDDDVMSFTSVDGFSECAESQSDTYLNMTDGHAYYVSVIAYNGAGLSSLATSWAFVVETSPPVGGEVYDGEFDAANHIKDIDYQTSTSVVSSHWEGFQDPHTAITEYVVSIGQCKQCEDIISEYSVGLNTELRIEHLLLKPGQTYYVTVTACNTADLCTSATSDGVTIDNSAPTSGMVFDGIGGDDTEYQSHRSTLSAKWYGFGDPHSGLSHYVVRAGTSRDSDDIMAPKDCHLSEEFVNNQLPALLPVGKYIFVTVRAYNKAGLYTESSSNGFMIDDTAPTFESRPILSSEAGSMVTNILIFRTSMKVAWKVSDPESFIERQYISIESHVGGDFNISSRQLDGFTRDFILTDLDLHDGSTYYVTIVACNGADVCSSSTSEGILVDSSPPTRGMFALHTEHSVNLQLQRNVTDSMVWSEFSLKLAWLGFSDVHSNVDHYVISVGETYMANDLLLYPNERLVHDVNTPYANAEDSIQVFNIRTRRLFSSMNVYISVTAVNGAGLRSPVVHNRFVLIDGGEMELVRRCLSLSCVGHCVCSPQDQQCPTSQTCVDVTQENIGGVVAMDIQNIRSSSQSDVDYIYTNMAISATWSSVGRNVLWYEWSIGYTHSDVPEGVYDHLDDRVWHDAGQFHNVTVTFPPGKELKSGFQYSVFIRSWYSSTTYALYKSDGVTIVNQPPSITKLLGAKVKERQHGSKKKEIDFTEDPRRLYIDWYGVFLNSEEHIEKYDIYISLLPGGHGVFENRVSLSAEMTSYNITWGRFRSQVKYYTNVIGYGRSGIHSTAVSDGFMFDTEQPISGVVADGIGLHDTDYQNASEQIGATWTGFSDTTGLVGYYWCVGLASGNSDCSVLPWQFVGLRTAFLRNLTTHIVQGSMLYNKVYAVDVVGHTSAIAVSDGFVMDYTAPIPSQYIAWGVNIVANPSFDSSLQNSMNFSMTLESDMCDMLTFYRPVYWSLEGCGGVVFTTKDDVKNAFLLVEELVSQKLENLEINAEYKVSFLTKHLTVTSSVISNAEAFVKFGPNKHVFSIHKKHGRNENGHREDFEWEEHLFYFWATSVRETLIIGSTGPGMGFMIDDIAVQKFDSVSDFSSDEKGHVKTMLHFIHEQSVIRAKWTFEDMESPIVDYAWSIGTVRGGQILQPLKSVGRKSFSSNSGLVLDHKTLVHVTMVATNAAGLRSILYADPILVDLTAPVVLRINDGSGEDLSMQSSNIITVNWKIEDPESSIQSCAWSIGTSPTEQDIQPFTSVPVTATSASTEIDINRIEGRMVYSTVQCDNGAGLRTRAVTNGVQVTTRPPVLPHGTIDVTEMSDTEYPTQDGYQSSTRGIKCEWTPSNSTDILYQFSVNGPGISFSDVIESMDPLVTKVYLSGGKMLSGGVYNISVSAINSLGMTSSALVEQLRIHTAMDKSCRGDKFETIVLTGNMLRVLWTDVFAETNDIHYYEVSAGTYGGADIVQWQYTTSDYLELHIPDKIANEEAVLIHVIVKAVERSGVFTTCKTNLYF